MLALIDDAARLMAVKSSSRRPDKSRGRRQDIAVPPSIGS
jgi:hypothetical protein